MANVVRDRIGQLRKSMEENNADWYFATSDDFHASEYVADYFKVREYYTGFTGENAFLVLNKDSAYMWTDGRFFLQADIELKDSGVLLMKMGEPSVPTIPEFFDANVKENDNIFFDGRMVSTAWGKKLENIAKKHNASVVFTMDLAGDLWTDRPLLPSNKITIYSKEVTGETTKSKLTRIREEINNAGAKYHFIGSVDDIAWITNMRGRDIECNPVFLSYMFISEKDAVLFLQKSEATDDVVKYLSENDIKVEEYENVISYLDKLKLDGKILLDEGSVNYACFMTLMSKASLVNDINPSKKMKSIKNEVEISRLKEAYLLDSVCVTKFAYWLKQAVKSEEVTELSAAAYIDGLRAKVPGFLDLSFPTISGYGPNGAIVHYSATEKSNAKVKPEGMLLVDSGGQYEKGTTDVTRTIACGAVTDKMKLFYTKTAIGMLSLADAKFMYGCTGRNLDTFARAPLWSLGYDYNHGTGHGVGYILNVHEGPQSTRWRFAEGVKEYSFEPGMITSDEPGVYITGEFGIRIENVILCTDDEKNEYGRFLKFEHLTYAPLDRALLDKNAMNEPELRLVNAYQEMVYNKVKDYLSEEEEKWLRAETLPL